MEVQAKYFPPGTIESSLHLGLIDIAKSAFPLSNNQYFQLLSHLDGRHTHAFIIFCSRVPAAFLFFQPRNAIAFGDTYSFITVGPVATHPDFQRKGLGSQLLKCLDSHCLLHSIDFIILSGIPNYYRRFGYYPFLIKSKITLRHQTLFEQLNSCSFEFAHVDRSPSLESFIYGNTEFKIVREQADWHWLLHCHPQSYYFPSPIFLHSRNSGGPLYYTSEQLPDHRLIREFNGSTFDDVRQLLSHLLAFQETSENLVFHTSFNSSLFRYLVNLLPFDYSAHPHPNGRAMMKIINQKKFLNHFVDHSAWSDLISLFKADSDALNNTIHKSVGQPFDYFLPGILSGLWKNVSDNQVFDEFQGFYLSDDPPFVYQGDSL